MPADRPAREPTAYGERVAMPSMHGLRQKGGERRRSVEHSFLLDEPPMDAIPQEIRPLVVTHDFSAISHQKTRVPRLQQADTLDVSVLELKAEIVHLAAQLEAATQDAENSASMNQKLRKALDVEVARSTELAAQVQQHESLSRAQISGLSENYQTRLQLREKELLNLSEDFGFNLELQKQEIKERDYQLHEIFHEIALKQEELIHNDISHRARFAEYLARQAMDGWRHQMRMVRRRYKLARKQVLRRLRQRTFLEWKLLASRDLALIQYRALSASRHDMRRFPFKDKLILLAETGQSLFLQARKETKTKQRAFSHFAQSTVRAQRVREAQLHQRATAEMVCKRGALSALVLNAERERSCRQMMQRGRMLRALIAWEEQCRLQRGWLWKATVAAERRRGRLVKGEVFRDWFKVVRCRQLARCGSFGWSLAAEATADGRAGDAGAGARSPRRSSLQASALTAIAAASMRGKEKVRALHCLTLLMRNKRRGALVNAMLGWTWLARSRKSLRHKLDIAAKQNLSRCKARVVAAWRRLVHTWQMVREVFAQHLCDALERSWRRWTRWFRVERKARIEGRRVLSEAYKSWRITAAEAAESRYRAHGMAGRWGLRIVRVRINFWRAWTWRKKLERIAVWRFCVRCERAALLEATAGWRGAVATARAFQERRRRRRKQWALLVWRRQRAWSKRKAMLVRRSERVTERMRELDMYHVMLGWYTLANRPGSTKETLLADAHYRERSLLTFFYHWMVFLEHTALTELGVERRALMGWWRETERAARERETACKALRWVADRGILLRALLSWGTRGTRHALLVLARRWMSRTFQIWQSATFRGRSSLLDALRGIDNALGRALLPPGQQQKSLLVVQPASTSILQASLDMRQRPYDENQDLWHPNAWRPRPSTSPPASAARSKASPSSPPRALGSTHNITDVSVSSAALVRQMVGSSP